MVAVFTIIFNRQDIGIYSNGSNGIGVLSIFLNKALQSIFINTNYIILIIQIATAYAVIYSNDSMTGFCGSDSISIIFLNGFDEFIFIEAYSIIIVTVIILTTVNSYIILTIILCSSNGVCVILLNKIAQLLAVNINLISMITFYAFICNFQDIGCRLYGSNSIGILCCFLDVALQSVLIDTDLIMLTVFLTFHAIIYSNDIVNRFSSCNGILIIGLYGIDELIFVNTYGIIIITVIINHFSNIYITFAVCLCGSNGVSIILLYKITQLVAVNINLIRMVAIDAFIGDFQHICFCFYGSNSISPGNAFQLISYPVAGCYIFYNRLNVIACRIINPYRQLAIFIQVSFHAGVSCVGILRCRCILNKSPQSILVDADPVMFVIGCWIISISIVNGNDRMTGFCCGNRISPGNAFQLISYPAAGSNAVYAVGVNSAGIISNLGSQRAVCKGQFIASNLGIGINNGCSNHLIISSYQLIGIDCLTLTGSCSNRFNNCILQACLTCFTVNGLRHGDIISVERFDNSVKFAYGNSAHRLFALHFGIVARMHRIITSVLRIPYLTMSMINKRCKQFNLLAGADLYLRMS